MINTLDLKKAPNGTFSFSLDFRSFFATTGKARCFGKSPDFGIIFAARFAAGTENIKTLFRRSFLG
jgi:hypothetical protein